MSSLCRVAGGPRGVLPALLPPCQSLWASSLLLQLSPGCQLFTLPGGGGWRAPPHEFAWPGQHPTLEPSLTHISAAEPGGGQVESDGVFFNPYPSPPPPDLIILVLSIGGTPDSSRQCQHKSIHLRVTVARSHERFLVLLLPFQSPQAWVTVPTPHDCSDSTETGLFSNNILYSLPPSPGMA